MKHICIGITAHVDAGKTTLSEAMLFRAGALKKMGRVDHRDAFLDTFALERERGITIFSKQAEFSLPHTEVTLLDTPGHVDFSAEMERTLQVLDYAVLVISGTDGVQAHTETLWRLLARHGIPTFLFVNKMDLDGAERVLLLRELKTRLSSGVVDFGDESTLHEELAVCDETLLERYFEQGTVADEDVVRLIRERKVFPCFFGSALRLDGVDALLDALCARAAALDLAFLTLEVRASNAPAIALYRKHGFQAVGQRRNYYQKPDEDALLMTWFRREAETI